MFQLQTILKGTLLIIFLVVFLTEVDGMPPWTAQKSSTLVPQYSLAVMHSNLWPGAHAFAVERSVCILTPSFNELQIKVDLFSVQLRLINFLYSHDKKLFEEWMEFKALYLSW